ncbi:odorant receptor 49a-like [Contarinia nasturtii]|uniref:odorant receptor 49a-like n=1 Tax=Contarinia nasturtii TaxID=265458 RepID=UPI0012D396DC|nr:odorant receptor 49a-like [Contarinia nasturtii]
MIYTACSIFLFDSVLQKFNLNIGVLFVCVFVSSFNLFLYCYFGNRSTDECFSYANLLFESSWFELPVMLEKFITVMIANAQRPLFYHGFGVARLNLDTFCSMLRAVISYYMAFKTLTKG